VPAREIVRYPSPILKQRCAEVEHPDVAARVAADLLETMRAHPRCVGLAAPQIGEAVRIVVVDASEHPKAEGAAHRLLTLVNPRIVEAAGAEVGREGCLSIPDLTANVRRATRVVVEASSLGGDALVVESIGFEARVLQHELDHLDGILFLDRIASREDLFRRRSYG
jgi:peptide deformylase